MAFPLTLAATVTGTLNLSASPGKISSSQALPFPFASFCSLPPCLSDRVMGQDKSPYLTALPLIRDKGHGSW